ncbi:MAG TPA: glucans biosynthesis glucosyltransferase MdoH [Pirellulales bacterium]|nr:glucans biosynthesis glucosyltransferase MdoH [Pirellulales bacterium]
MDQNRRWSALWPRFVLAALTVITTAVGVWALMLAHPDSGPIAQCVRLTLFAALFVWIAFSFWTATAGFLRRLLRGSTPLEPHTKLSRSAAPRGRTAILVPVYNESPHRVFAGLRAIYESLQTTGHAGVFDFFVLSDTTDPEIWLQEEWTWARLTPAFNGASQVYYRHRPKNIERKAGNIADFCERWGSMYEYMVVLDADSVMSGETLVEMVCRMDADPQLGILQAPPMPVNRQSLFARCQQFASRVYGPVFLEGFTWWAQTDGNYWGHNAILRIDAFIKHCGLPKLSGSGALAGEILSHDFVEAAFMRRAGYKVCIADDLEGSYEECPPNMIAYAQRDQRWCQGNMQHLRLVFGCGMHPVSRLHMGMGAMSYLSSPLWMASILMTFVSLLGVEAASAPVGEARWPWSATLFAGTMAMLFLPKLWSYLVLLRDRRLRIACGGARKAALSMLVEMTVSVAVAPIMMVFHTTFVIYTFLGKKVQWSAQERDEQGLAIGAALQAHWKQTVGGLSAALFTYAVAPEMLLWLSPVLGGLILSIPISVMLSSVRIGQALARRGLLATPDETEVPLVLKRHRHLLALTPAKELTDGRGMFRRVLADPAFLALHRSILRATDGDRPIDPLTVRAAERQLLAGGPARVALEHRKAILSNSEALKNLHFFAWTSTRGEERE